MTALRKKKPLIDAASLLRETPLCAGLEEPLLKELATTASVRTFPKGFLLYSLEEAGEWFYLLADGWIKLFRETLDGDEAVLDILTSGHLFGETALFGNGRYSTSAQVIEDSTLLMMPLSTLRRLIEREPRMALNMLDSMAQFRHQQERELEHRSLQNAPQRIGCFLLRLCNDLTQKQAVLHLPYDKTLIAARLGMKPETFSRALARLKEETGITVKGPSIHINDIQRLADYTCSACSHSFPCEDKC